MANTKAARKIENMNVSDSKDLCKLAEMIGYKDTHFGQLQCSNGAFVSSLLNFFDDNPGAIVAVQNFIVENIDCYDVEIDEDTDDEMCPGCGCMPGEGITEECNDLNGCGFGKTQREL